MLDNFTWAGNHWFSGNLISEPRVLHSVYVIRNIETIERLIASGSEPGAEP